MAEDAVILAFESKAENPTVFKLETEIIRRLGPQLCKRAREDERAKLDVDKAALQHGYDQALAALDTRHAKELDRIQHDSTAQLRMAHAHGFHKGASWFGAVGMIVGAAGMAGILTWANTAVFSQAVDAASTRDMNDRIFQRIDEAQGRAP